MGQEKRETSDGAGRSVDHELNHHRNNQHRTYTRSRVAAGVFETYQLHRRRCRHSQECLLRHRKLRKLHDTKQGGTRV